MNEPKELTWSQFAAIISQASDKMQVRGVGHYTPPAEKTNDNRGSLETDADRAGLAPGVGIGGAEQTV